MKLNRKELEEKIVLSLRNVLGKKAKDISPEHKLIEDLGLDSFGSVEVAFELEERFELKIPDEALYKAKTVKDIVDFVAEQTDKK